jgi:glutathionyl-hydroquinone reductase
MAYSHKTQFPRSFLQVVDVTTTAQPIFAASTGNYALSFLVVANTTGAARTIMFRAVDNTPEVVRVTLLANTSIVLPGWRVDAEGLEVVDAASVAAGVYCTAFYVSHAQS